MLNDQKAKFAKLIAALWLDENLVTKLMNNPQEELKKFGLATVAAVITTVAVSPVAQGAPPVINFEKVGELKIDLPPIPETVFDLTEQILPVGKIEIKIIFCFNVCCT